MSPVSKIREIQQAVTIPVMAKCRIGHFGRGADPRGPEGGLHRRVGSPDARRRGQPRLQARLRVPFVCGCRNLGEALRRIGEGAAMIRTKGRRAPGDIVHAVRHLREVWRDIRNLTLLGKDERMAEAKRLGAPYELVVEVAETGKLPVPNFAAGGIATPADAALCMALGAEAVFVGSGIFKSDDPGQPRPRDRQGDDALARRAGPGRGRRVPRLGDEGDRGREPARRGTPSDARGW